MNRASEDQGNEKSADHPDKRGSSKGKEPKEDNMVTVENNHKSAQKPNEENGMHHHT